MPGTAKVKARPKRPIAGRETDPTTVVNPEAGAHYRLVSKRDRLKFQRAKREGYEPVKWTEEGEQLPMMGDKGEDGFVHVGRDLILMRCRSEDFEDRSRARVEENIAQVKKHRVQYVQEQLRSGTMTEAQAREFIEKGIVVEYERHG